jgi:hypothetical protein
MRERQWDKPSFFKELRKECSEAAYTVAQQLLAWCETQGYKIIYGDGIEEGTLAPSVYLYAKKRDCKLFEVFTRHNDRPGYVLLASYLWQTEWPESPFGEDKQRRKLIAQLNKLPLNAPLPQDAHNKRPWITLEKLSDPETFRTFKEVHEWAAKEITG